MSPSTTPRVRMYRQGLGDCFLLSLPRAGAEPFHCLIDCGVLLGTPDAPAVMRRVAENIARETGNHLDVVVVTHEHWDHVSGFLQARDVFDRMTIGELWFAWTEDPTDPLANRLRQQREQAQRSIAAMATRTAALDVPAAERQSELLSFFGATAGPSTRDALNYLVNHPSQPTIRYHKPGEPPLKLPDGTGTSAYVLGPPRDEKLLRRSDPTKSGHEVYEFGPDLAQFTLAADDWGGDESAAERSQPFEERYRLSREQAEGRLFFRQHYFRNADEWRSIEGDWLGVTEQLALALDNHTNNTSLALAFELEPGGRVLLFPGDAQVGNWLSWDGYRWPVENASGREITIADLLARTVLYKVGHHASHNATLREKGLERMISPDLVAMIPVNVEMAKKKRWSMPFPGLHERLLELAGGRVIQADQSLPSPPPGSSARQWQRFLDRVVTGEEGLYYDLHFESSNESVNR